MIEIKSPIDLARLRRIALFRQGLLQPNTFGMGMAGALKAIQHIGYVQIDTISVVERAHHHVLYSRVPEYFSEMMVQMLHSKKIFEYWSHAASFLPMEDYRFSLPYKQAIKSGQTHWHKNKDTKLMAELLLRIKLDGPLRSRDIKSTANKRGKGWWDWKPAKQALEQLYMEGDLMVSNRDRFQKAYDLTERVLPPHVDSSMPDLESLASHLLEQHLRCHGLVALNELVYLRRILGLRQKVKALLSAKLADGVLEQLCFAPYFAPANHIEHPFRTGSYLVEAGLLDQAAPENPECLQILSPFDNAVIQRRRLKAIFGFDYQIECYVPALKRQYGYFCLLLLYGDQFIGRMDCKAHRKTKELEIKSLHFEPHKFAEEQVLAAFSTSMASFIQFQGCDHVLLGSVVPRKKQSHLYKALNKALHAKLGK